MLKKQILTIISIAIFCQGIAQTNFYQTEVFKEIGNKKEDISKRDAYSKHYINDDGSYTALIGSGPIHYEKNGKFEDIDTKLMPNNDPVFVYANKTNIFESYFGVKTSDGVKSKTKEGEITEFLNTTMYWEVNGQATNIKNSEIVEIETKNNKAYYNNIYGEISAEFVTLTGKRELNYIIPNQQALGNIPTNAEYLVFTEDIILPNGWTANKTERGVMIYDNMGNDIVLYENPHSTDAETMALREKNTIYNIEQNENILSIKTKVKTEWLLSNERVFPIIVDPTTSVYPNAITNWTRSVASDGYNYADLQFGTDISYWVIGFMKFNLTNIPSSATINSASAYVYVWDILENSHSLNRFAFLNANDPTQYSDSTLYNSAVTYYSNDLPTNQSNGWKNASLNSTATTHIKNAFGSYISMSIKPEGSWHNTSIYKVRNHIGGPDGTLKPYLLIDYSSSTNCSGTPTPGTASILPNSDTHGQGFTASVNGSTMENGITYQWQSAPSASGPWTNIPGATSASYSGIAPYENGTVYYRRIITCTYSSQSAYSNAVSFTTTCTPQHTDGNAPGSGYGYIGISNVSIGTINNTTGYQNHSPSYNYYSGHSTNVELGQTYTLSVTYKDDGSPYNPGEIGVWVDWNGDGDFSDANEFIGIRTNVANGSTQTFDITVPAGTTPGTKRLRVRSAYNGEGFTSNDACTVMQYGETEDYNLNVISSERTLSVSEAYNGATYANGSHSFANNTSVTATSGTRTGYIVTGWTGTGSVPDNGTGSSVTFTITQNSTINWLWQQTGTPDNIKFYNYGGDNQLAFNNSRLETTTPIFRISHEFYDASDYQIQISTSPTFGGTPWTQDFSGSYPLNTEANFEFSNNFAPTNNTTYYVRVRVKGAANIWSDWTTETYSFTYQTPSEIAGWFQTTQAQFQTDELNGTLADANHDVVLAGGGGGNRVDNGEFYSTDHWTITGTSGTDKQVKLINNPGGFGGGNWLRMGSWSWGTGSGTIVVSQEVDLTGIDEITFNAGGYYNTGSPFVDNPNTKLEFKIGGTLTNTLGTSLYNESHPSDGQGYNDYNFNTPAINVSSYSGVQVIKFVMTYISDWHGNGSVYYYIDDVIASAPPTGTITSTPIHFASVVDAEEYDEVIWNQTLGGGTLNIEVQGSVNGTSWSNISGYGNISEIGDGEKSFDISGINPTTYPHLRLIGTIDGAGVKLHNWAISMKSSKPEPPSGTKDPNFAEVCEGTTLTLIDIQSGSGGSINCQDEFRYSTNGGNSWGVWANTAPVFDAVVGTNIIQTRRICDDGESDYNEYIWEVVAQPTIDNTSAEAICTGGESTISASLSGGTGTYSYEWLYFDGSNWSNISQGTPANAIYSNTDSNELTVSGIEVAGEHKYKLRAYNSLGCEAISNEIILLVEKKPVAPTVTMLPADTDVCQGTLISINVESSGSGGITTCTDEFRFSIDGGNSWSEWRDTIPYFTAQGSDNRIEARRICDASGCESDIDTYQWNVHENPTIDNISANEICLGGTGNITAVVNGGSGNYNYQWQYQNNSHWEDIENNSPLGAIYTNENTATLSVSGISSTNEYSYRLIVIDNNGCEAISDAATLIIHNPPIAPEGVKSPNVATVCEGTILTLEDVQSGTGGAGNCQNRYAYHNGESWSEYSDDVPQFEAQIGTNYIIAMRVCDGDGCDNVQNSYQWTVVAQPTISDISIDNEIICVSGSSQISASSISGGSGTYDYQWQYYNGTDWVNVENNTPADALYSTNSDNDLIISGISAIGEYKYRLEVSNFAGCEAISNEITLEVVPKPTAPEGTKSPDLEQVCQGTVVTIIHTNDGEFGTGSCQDEYRYSTNNGSNWSDWDINIPEITTEIGVNIIEARRSCQGSACGSSETIEYIWTAVENPTIDEISINYPIICINGNSEITAEVSGGANDYTYQWQFLSSTTWENITSEYPEHANHTGFETDKLIISDASQTGNYEYRLIVSDGNSCEDISANIELEVVDKPSTPEGLKSPNTDEVCAGEILSVNITNNGSGGAGDCGIEYSHSIDGGTTWSEWSDVASSLTATGSDNRIKIRRACESPGCESDIIEYSWIVIDPEALTAPTIVINANETICAGSSITLTAEGGNNVYSSTYIWYVDEYGVAENLIGNTQSITVSPLAPTTYFVGREIDHPTCGFNITDSIAATVSITLPDIPDISGNDYVWTGAIDELWDEDSPNNWLVFDTENSYSIPQLPPTENSNVHIKPVDNCFTTSPEVSTVDQAQCNNLFVYENSTLIVKQDGRLTITADMNNSGTLTSNTNSEISLKGDWLNQGTYNAMGLVKFVGESPQEILSGQGDFYSVLFDNSKGFYLLDAMTINADADFSEGIVNLLEEASSISFGPNATSNIGNNSSYVDGIISKTGENAFNFATGDGTYWGPISISSAVSSRTITANYNYEQTPIVNWNTGYMCNDDERLDHVSGMEYWLLESSVNDGNQPDVTLYWADDALSDIQNHASLRVAHWGGSCWANKGGSAMVDAVSGVGYITSTKPFTHYSPITFGTIDKTNELPVELIDFDVSCGNNNRIVSWTTASEINNDYFIVERSTNGIIYENIGKKAGSGNSNIINEYIFVDDSNISGDMYYRITQIDFDGTSKTYNAQIINCDESGENITIRPNPFNEVLEIVAHIDDICKIEIYNTLSKLIYSEVSHIRGAKKLQLGDLQNGVYMLRISTKNGKTFNYKIIKH